MGVGEVVVCAAKVGEEGSLVKLVEADESNWKEATERGAVSHPAFVKEGCVCDE